MLPGEYFPAIIFLHGYTRGGLQAISQYHLDQLDARNGQPFIIITPNGRQVCTRTPANPHCCAQSFVDTERA
jgi:hypothetical protein